MAARLQAAGLRGGDRLLLVSENRYQWIICDLAVHLCSGVHVAVHNSLAGPQIAEQLRDSGARLVVVAGAEQAEKLNAAASSLPDGLQFLSFDPVAESIGGRPVRHLAAIAIDPSSIAEPACAAFRSGHDSLHLGHDRRAARRDAQPRQFGLQRGGVAHGIRTAAR